MTTSRRNLRHRYFRGVDGEGVSRPDGSHHYQLLTVGTDSISGDSLDHRDIIPFLADQDPDVLHVGYYLDYDWTMTLRSLPADQVRSLLDRESRIGRRTGFTVPITVQIDGVAYHLDYLPHKELTVKREGGKQIIYSDVGQFFQCSFLRALELWDVGDPDMREKIREGKQARRDLKQVADHTKEYNALEITLLETLMERFRQVCFEVGYVPHRWQGPGTLAAAAYRRNKVPRRQQMPVLAELPQLAADANTAYIAGRFEGSAVGPVPGPVHQYDLNTAYGHAYLSLPCLLHGRWTLDGGPSTDLYLSHVRFHHAPYSNRKGSGGLWCHLPVRTDKGGIIWPRQAQGWYWSVELDAAARAGTMIEHGSTWNYHRECDCTPFDWVPEVYAERLRLGKDMRGKVLKTVLASLYGKMAQSVGSAPYANAVWASLTTATTRARIIDAYDTVRPHDHCVMVATDAVFSTQELPLPVSTRLGEWSHVRHPTGLFIVQSGVYFSDESMRSRGISRSLVHQRREDFEAAWQECLSQGDNSLGVDVAVDSFITLKSALHRNKFHLAGTWTGQHPTPPPPRHISFNWGGKRAASPTHVDRHGHRTHPQPGSPDLESVGYRKTIGGDRDIDDVDGQPDWADTP